MTQAFIAFDAESISESPTDITNGGVSVGDGLKRAFAAARLTRLSKQEQEQIDAEATALYERLNPEPDVRINVSKAECIRRVMKAKKK